MQNIENITLENWPDSETRSPATKQIYHFAVKQSGINLDYYMERFFPNREISLHFFEDIKGLAIVCHRYAVNAILMGGRDDFQHEVELAATIKNNIQLSIVPVILFHPEPSRNIIIAAYENGVEEFIYGEWVDRLIQVRVERVINRSERDISVNPSTSLPGPTLIEKEINRQIDLGEKFAVCYADLDNFKAFNDYSGYVYGDKIIRLTGRILRDVVFDLCPEGFVGHIAGDDFICVIPAETVHEVCNWIIKSFDAFVPFRYSEEDRQRGWYETRSRQGELERYDLLSISIAVVINEDKKFKHMGELSKMLADLKKITKAQPGSNYMIERRKKY